ncbi:hypothetical protein E2562_033921 [Oryza meyeriana var. granulata]|uniref:Uncharacterized protein n=1 Tax=Oryza meyeriana var. granulata TaxID=110450 RepID=A0A6G1C1K0_9ORYZ|nr:hypothetical protein E2562_033921 [Oryza meyeriana var. granulata]
MKSSMEMKREIEASTHLVTEKDNGVTSCSSVAMSSPYASSTPLLAISFTRQRWIKQTMR